MLHTTRKLSLDILAIIFGISAWISINGLWVELPLMVQKLPESWALASHMSIIVQMANMGPISYSLIRWKYPDLSKSAIIYPLLGLGAVASLLLALFWDETSYIFGNEHSTSLYVLVFFLALVDCTSSVLFLPYMILFKEIYLNSYLIGEGLSGFLPAVVALIQGVGGNPTCENVTTTWQDHDNAFNDYQLTATYPEPRFSVEVFFFILMSMMVASSIAFSLIDRLSYFDSEREKESTSSKAEYEVTHSSSDMNTEGSSEALSTITTRTDRQTEFWMLMLLQTYVCFMSNGALPSIQTYSCLPFGNVVYHLAVTLHAMINPVMAFSAFFFPCKRVGIIALLASLGSIFVGFILATALYSPEKLLGQDVGGALTVASWIIYGGLFSYVKVCIAGLCRQASDKALFWCGAWTQIGSALGSLLFFFLVNYTSMFQQYYACDDPTTPSHLY